MTVCHHSAFVFTKVGMMAYKLRKNTFYLY